jgi:4-amino-4-deoxy-L-arabinose transferase-like glycosyltransferase
MALEHSVLSSPATVRCTKNNVQNARLSALSSAIRASSTRLSALPSSVLFVLLFAVVVLSHLTLLRLPYYWDEGGYYIPAALDFYRTGQLVPHYTNAHTPLPNILLGSLWHIVGIHILATRLLVSAFAAAGLLAVFRLTQRLLDSTAAITVTLLTLVYPIWFAQSTLAHADIFAAAFTLAAFALYLPAPAETSSRTKLAVAALFSLAALSKETSIVQPATLAALQLALLFRDRRFPALRREHLTWIAALAFPLLPLLAWFAYHHHVTGFTFGNPEYLRYNATANLTSAHILQALRYRFLHLFWQRNIWVPIVFALACLFLPRVEKAKGSLNPKPSTLNPVVRTIALLVAANWLAFSILGGALLTRYLLPVYPLILIVCVYLWQTRTRWWGLLAAASAAAFISALWINPPTSFAPEDNLTYRDMIVVHQEAIDFVAQHYPDATILTAWPVAADVFNPWLGYVSHPLHATSIEDFTLPQIQKAASEPERYDTAIVFTTHFVAPALRNYLLAHPNAARLREFNANRDLTPEEIASVLHGQIVWQDERNGEWAAVLRFDRTYEASIRYGIPCQTKEPNAKPRARRSSAVQYVTSVAICFAP